MKTRNRGIKKEMWISFCSKHQEYCETCELCKTGTWENVIKYKLEDFFFSCFPRLWTHFKNKK